MRFSFLVFLIVKLSFVWSQNLVPNSSFEESTSCPGGHTERIAEFHVREWQSANAGTPDHFHACSIGNADVPHNWAGISDAYEGEGYIGLYAWMDNGIDYREYAQCKLISPLLKDSMYIIQFQYKLSTYSKYAVDRIGILLTDSIIKWRGDRAPNLEPTFHALKDTALTESTGAWETGRWEFRAKGGEQFLTLGNFYDNEKTNYYSIKFRDTPEVMLSGSAYYYIDAVKVYSPFSLPDEEKLIPRFTAEHVTINTPYILKNIQFEFDSYKLLATSFDELDELVKYVFKHPHIAVQISGHTDDVGGDRYNTKLSRNRAESVAKYLMLQGIGKDRIETYGYGKSKPLIQMDSDEARKINRRVEIRFIE